MICGRVLQSGDRSWFSRTISSFVISLRHTGGRGQSVADVTGECGRFGAIESNLNVLFIADWEEAVSGSPVDVLLQY